MSEPEIMSEDYKKKMDEWRLHPPKSHKMKTKIKLFGKFWVVSNWFTRLFWKSNDYLAMRHE